MKVIVSAGGTGGHIYPALAIIDKIKEKEPKTEFLYIGTHNRMEKDIVPEKGIPFKTIEIYGFNRKKILTNFKTVSCFIKSIKKCKKIIKEFSPDIVIGVGGYVTGPVLYSAHKLGIKTIIHEQNINPGKANRFLSKYVDRICTSFKNTKEGFPKEKIIFTGNPCSEKALASPEIDKTKLGFSKNKQLVIIVMGSLGAGRINDKMTHMLSLFNNKDYEVLYITGQNYFDKISSIKLPSNVKVLPYLDNLPGLMKSCDLIVSRSGASILSEIVSLEIPSLLIPSPFVANNEQLLNAKDLVNNNAALLIEEKDLDGDILVRKIDEMLLDKKKYKEIKNNLKKLSVNDSSTRIYNVIKEIVGD